MKQYLPIKCYVRYIYNTASISADIHITVFINEFNEKGN